RPGNAPAGQRVDEGPAGYEAEEAADEEEGVDPNAYVSSTYLGGRGSRERLAKLIEEGVLVDGKTVKLEAFSREYSQAFSIPTKTALSLSAETERGKAGVKGGLTHLQVGIQATEREAPKRPPLNICLVVDRSGSMGQEGKIEYARQAAIEVVERLAASDTIALVAYDHAAEVLASAQKATNNEALRQKLAALQPGGSTDIYSALELGYKEVEKGLAADAINQVILLSDGMVTAGTSDLGAFGRLTAGMFDQGIQASAIGMGLDYDEELMMTVAREGKGNYHFVRDAASIGDILREEMDDLTHVVAKALRLRIHLAEGVEVVRVLGSAQMEEEAVEAAKETERKVDERVYRELGISRDREKIEDEPGIKMLIPQFYMGDSHVVMLEIEVPPGKGTRRVADVYLKYKDVVFRQNRDMHEPVEIGYTSNEETMLASIRQPVKKNVLGFQTGEALKKAVALSARGENGKAAKAIDEQMVVLGVAAREWKDPDLDKDGALLAAYKDVIGGLGTRYVADTELGQYLAKSLTYSAYQRTH
ncbi:MAG: VWA domain-containing protein, partial [Armatimonadota bacterium]